MKDHDSPDRHILDQALVALGQGTGPIRISRTACQAFSAHYGPRIISKKMAARWGEEGVQALERVRAIGRLATQKATADARTAIEAKDIQEAIREVEQRSATALCDDGG